MIVRAFLLVLVGSMMFGCVSGQTHLPTGTLTAVELKQLNTERQKIVNQCRSKHTPLESVVWDCLGELVPLSAQMGDEFSEAWANYLKSSRRIAYSFERGTISEQAALKRMSRTIGQFTLEMQRLEEQIDRKLTVAKS
jgi:hypothetical protein